MCKLRPEWVNLTLDEQAAFLLGCHEADAYNYASCGATKMAVVDALKACAR
jgi:hypothetical protein